MRRVLPAAFRVCQPWIKKFTGFPILAEKFEIDIAHSLIVNQAIKKFQSIDARSFHSLSKNGDHLKRGPFWEFIN